MSQTTCEPARPLDDALREYLKRVQCRYDEDRCEKNRLDFLLALRMLTEVVMDDEMHNHETSNVFGPEREADIS